jgi:lipid-A-disaccharide synthase
MQAAGCHAIDDLTGGSAMLLHAVRMVGRAWRLVRRVRRALEDEPADLAVLIDSPALHLPMAKQIRAAGCPILHYIAPQLWAWAPWRIRRLRRRVDRLAVILPFEQAYFRHRGVQAQYVGNPLVEQLAEAHVDSALCNELRGAGDPVVACLPGSRMHVIREVLPGQREVARAIAHRHAGAVMVFAAASEAAAECIERALHGEPFSYRVLTGRNAEILSVADVALCASGTATLEVAWYGVPMVVMYNGSKWGYRLVGRRLIRTPHLSLVNILAGRCVVPEFMPYYDSTEPVAAEALDLLVNKPRRAAMQGGLERVVESLGVTRASEKTADMALAMIQQHCTANQ